jgi:hypothetical protein
MELTEKILSKEIDMRSRILICFAAAALAVIGFFSAASGCQSEQTNASAPDKSAQPAQAPPADVKKPEEKSPAAVKGTGTITVDNSSVPEEMGLRPFYPRNFEENLQRKSLADEGGSPGTEDAVRAALRWLRNHQDTDGRWDIDGFSKNCRRGTCDGAAQAPYFDVGVSALALLAYLGNGQTHQKGEFKATVRKGFRFLKSEQGTDGRFGPNEGESWFYNHAIALAAICEAYAITKDSKMKAMAQSALTYGLDAQNPGYGWKYEPKGGKNDTSVTGWMVMALKAAKTAGLEVPKQSFEDARKWFDRVTASNGRCGYEKPGDPGSRLRGQPKQFERQECNTAVALTCRIFMGQNRGDWQIKKGAELLMQKLPTYDEPNKLKVNYYYWYYGTNAMFQIGGADWKKWNEAMKKALVKTQRRGGCVDGSWNSECEWAIVGGRAYCTAINALTLETYYRYKRFEKDAEDKKPAAKSDKAEDAGAKTPVPEEKPKGE